MDDLDSVLLNLKACLLSTKGGIPLSQIESKFLKYFFVFLLFLFYVELGPFLQCLVSV